MSSGLWPKAQKVVTKELVPGLIAKVSVDLRALYAYLDISNYPEKFDHLEAAKALREFCLAVFGERMQTEFVERQIPEFLEKRRTIVGKVVARGLPSEPGKDAIIKYLVPRPTKDFLIRESGAVDFKMRDLFRSVLADEEVLIKIPPQEGVPGVDVFGKDISPHPVRDMVVLPGKEVTLLEAEDGQITVKSNSPGQVLVEEKRLSVAVQITPILIINGNIDLETGNLFFKGSVEVRGSIQMGFSVVTTGNLSIEGVIEPGAKVTVGGDLVVGKGILGGAVDEDSQQTVRVFGNLQARYAENAKISVQGDIFLQSVMNSEVQSNGSVFITKSLVGGQVIAFKTVDCGEIGNPVGAKTLVHCGVSHLTVGRLNLVVKILEDLKLQQEKVGKNLKFLSTQADQMPLDKKEKLEEELSQKETDLSEQILRLEMKKADLALILLEENQATVSGGVIHTGVQLRIRSSPKAIDKEYVNSTFFQKLPEEIIEFRPR